MSSTFKSAGDPDQPMIYQIRIKGHLGREWTDWFEGLTLTLEDNGETLLTGALVDQAALFGCSEKCVMWACPCSRSVLSNPARQRQKPVNTMHH